MKKWIILLGLLVFFAVIALVVPAYARSALGMGIGAMAMTLLNQVVDVFTGERNA